MYPAIARAVGSLFTKSTANVGPEITHILFVFKVFFTKLERVLNVALSIPFDAMHIGVFL